ncbi:MAG TPA: glycosyltransferase family 9 protein, partial [Urbifossiella sp.]|nr:glycosyltransferase family 9 protein [Urbifossiella sp.]
VARSMTAPALDLAGKTDLGAAAALLRRARLLVANDTGVSHLAAAVRTRSVIVSTGDNPARWSPLNERLHRVLCAKSGTVPVAAVARTAIDLLKRRHRPAHSDLALCGPSAS